jgi:hypothetical protein
MGVMIDDPHQISAPFSRVVGNNILSSALRPVLFPKQKASIA